VKPGISERSPERAHRYVAHVDPSGGVNDSMTLAVAHKVRETVVLDCVREFIPPFSPEGCVEAFCDVLKRYRVKRITSDRYAGEWPREQFLKRGVVCEPAERSASQYYVDFLPQLTEGAVDLLDNERLIAQFAALERSPRRGTHDSVSHPPSGHDDLANAVAAACSQAMARYSAHLHERDYRPLQVESCSRQYYA